MSGVCGVGKAVTVIEFSSFKDVGSPTPPRIVVIGDSGVGKTTLSSALSGKPVRSPFATIGLDFYRVDIETDDSVSRIHVWDCSGQDQFFPLIPSARKHEESTFFVLYDVTNEDSFRRVPHWVDIARNRAGSKKIVIIGNKTDLVSERKIHMRDGMELAGALQTDFLETSALEDQTVKDMLIRLVIDRRFRAVYSDTSQRYERHDTKDDACCCSFW
jgi:small GTP-binding protein